MILPRLFNHGVLRSIKKENGKLVLEGTTGKEEFEGGGGLPDIGESDAGKVLMVDGGEAKWLWQLPPGSAGQFLKRTGTGQNFAFSNIKEVPDGGNNQDVLTKTASGYMWAPPVSTSRPTIKLYVSVDSYVLQAGLHNYSNKTIWFDSFDSDISNYIIEGGTSANSNKNWLDCNIVLSESDNNKYIAKGLIHFSKSGTTLRWEFTGTATIVSSVNGTYYANKIVNVQGYGDTTSIDMEQPIILTTANSYTGNTVRTGTLEITNPT